MKVFQRLTALACLMLAASLDVGPGGNTDAAAGSTNQWWDIYANNSCAGSPVAPKITHHGAALGAWNGIQGKFKSYEGYNVHGCQPYPYRPLP